MNCNTTDCKEEMESIDCLSARGHAKSVVETEINDFHINFFRNKILIKTHLSTVLPRYSQRRLSFGFFQT